MERVDAGTDEISRISQFITRSECQLETFGIVHATLEATSIIPVLKLMPNLKEMRTGTYGFVNDLFCSIIAQSVVPNLGSLVGWCISVSSIPTVADFLNARWVIADPGGQKGIDEFKVWINDETTTEERETYIQNAVKDFQIRDIRFTRY